MNQIIARLILCFSLIALDGCGIHSPPVKPPAIAPFTLSCTIAPSMTIKDHKEVRVEITNLTSATRPFLCAWPESFYLVTVYRGTQAVEPYSAGLRELQLQNNGLAQRDDILVYSGPSPTRILPFGSVKETFDLSQYFDFSEPGRYVLVVQRRVGEYPGALIGALATFIVPLSNRDD